MIAIYQIQLSDLDIAQVNAGQMTERAKAKFRVSASPDNFTYEVLKFYKEVAWVDTDDLEKAFELTNLWEEPSKVTKFGKMSSTSVGDIFLKGDQFYMVNTFGFTSLFLFADETEMMECAQ